MRDTTSQRNRQEKAGNERNSISIHDIWRIDWKSIVIHEWFLFNVLFTSAYSSSDYSFDIRKIYFMKRELYTYRTIAEYSKEERKKEYSEKSLRMLLNNNHVTWKKINIVFYIPSNILILLEVIHNVIAVVPT